jgi:hypothetical protein
MKKSNEFTGRAVVVTIFIALISISIVGIVAAADPQPTDTHGHPISSPVGTCAGTSCINTSASDMMETCEQMMGNTSMMSGTMMGGSGMMNTGSVQMMESVEVTAMGGPMHDEMQGLVTKMMAGSLSSSDQSRMIEIMNKYPGASNMMMTRMIGGNGQGWSGCQSMMGTGGVNNCAGIMGGYGATGGAGMMNSGFMSLGVVLVVLFFVVWLVVGILLIIWLINHLQKDKIQP